MEMDRIRMKSNSDIAFYHILIRIRMRIQIFSNTNTKWIPRIRIHIRIFTQFNAKRISLNSIETNKILVPRSSIAKANQNQIIHLIISEVIVN